jgi:hypothetical protein
MKKMRLLLSVTSLALCDQAASANLHWKGPDGVFEEMSSWIENNKVPSAEDFIIVKNYSGANWSVSFTKDETSWKSELGTPQTNVETAFKLNGHTWALTYDIHMGELTSGGGRIAFTNGTLRVPSLSFIPAVTNNLLTVALTGYTLGELKTTLPLIRMPTASIDIGKVTVTLNGQPNAFLSAKYVADGGQQVLSVSYSAGTLIRLL